MNIINLRLFHEFSIQPSLVTGRLKGVLGTRVVRARVNVYCLVLGNDNKMTSRRADENGSGPTKSGKRKRKTEPSGFVPTEVNPAYREESFKEAFGGAFRKQESCEHENEATLLRDPFSCCVLPNFVKDEAFLQGLKDELLDLPFEEKSNDLYKFQQSGALQNFSSPHIIGLRKFLYEDFLAWLRNVTCIPLDDTVDMTCSKYNYTDSLLCHDDELGGRRIAFILYLVPQWEEEDGGALDLFTIDAHGQPSHVVKSLLPKWNNFVFFEVTPRSFHQVAEVLSQDKCRLSVSGWFHGPRVDRPTPYVEPRIPLQSYCTIEEDEIFDWINPLYLDVLNQSEIQDRFTDDSEIQLENFLQKEKYELVSKALESSDVRWQKIGPANKRSYETADMSTLPQVLQDCLAVLQSEHMFLTLSNFTGLKLHENAPNNDSDDEDDGDDDDCGEEAGEEINDETSGGDANSADGTTGEDGVVIVNSPRASNPRCRAQVRRWRHGCYTLLHDTDTEGSEFALDAVIHFNCPEDLQTDHGGYISYIAKAEDEELLSVSPENNGLSLVYRDKETLRFVKHINHRFTECHSEGDREPVIYDIQLVYYE
ncbi:prolyl 3-hydroxylase OGFOD1-like [Patiria miniata]|uniref:uS12 prolyl 3-hydroxylase n=1 Tax=Patiria miniata TaxID=46514 RepID=A0A914AXH3_PATMI|nr:prolyl 3-hydroxylase OGFOD1-like [Patiria miniata]